MITSHRHPNKFLLKSARFYFKASLAAPLVMLPTSTDHIQCSCFCRPILFSYCVNAENIHTSPMEGTPHPSGNSNLADIHFFKFFSLTEPPIPRKFHSLLWGEFGYFLELLIYLFTCIYLYFWCVNFFSMCFLFFHWLSWPALITMSLFMISSFPLFWKSVNISNGRMCISNQRIHCNDVNSH